MDKFAGTVKFETRDGVDKTASKEKGCAVYKEEDWAVVTNIGGNATTEHKIALVKKGKPKLWAVIEKGYEAWKEGRELPVDGTPLVGWSGATRPQIETLANFNVKTVEHLAGIPDGDLKNLPGGTGRLRELAKAYMTEANSVGRVAQDLVAANERAESLEAQVNEMQAQLEELTKPKKPAGRSKAA